MITKRYVPVKEEKDLTTNFLSRKEAVSEIKMYASACSELEKVEAEIEKKTQILHEKYRKRVENLQHAKGKCAEQLQLYALYNADVLFEEKRSASLGSIGTIGLRKGKNRVKTSAGNSWEDVMREIKEKNLPFLRVKEEIDKQKILLAASEKGRDNMGLRSITIVSSEYFYIRIAGENAESLAHQVTGGDNYL